jgi:hypothetical protein
VPLQLDDLIGAVKMLPCEYFANVVPKMFVTTESSLAWLEPLLTCQSWMILNSLNIPPPPKCPDPCAANVTLNLITGRGLHSKGMPKLLHAVREYLTDRGYHFDEKVGSFHVFLSAPSSSQLPE